MTSPDEKLIASPRLNYYNPLLDPAVVCSRMTPDMARAVEQGDYNDGSVERGGPLLTPDETHPYNLISSLREDGLHSPALDVDKEASAAVVRRVVSWYVECGEGDVLAVRSSNFWHAYIPWIALDWASYVELLHKLAMRGILQPGYVDASIGRGQTLLRAPHVRKIEVDE